MADIDRFMAKVHKNPNSCWEWQGQTDKDGYGRFATRVLGKTKAWMAHRFSYSYYKQDPGKLFVCHSCDNTSCVNPDHLWLGTHKDNMRDMKSKNRQKGSYKQKYLELLEKYNKLLEENRRP